MADDDDGHASNWRPIPDPTLLTGELVDKAIKNVREILEVRIVSIESKLNDVDNHWNARHSTFVSEIREYYVEKFQAIRDLIDAERVRNDSLAEMKERYDKQISETQTTQLKTTSDLVSTQLDKVTNSQSEQLSKTADNITQMLTAMDKRVAAIEQKQYETAGRSSVSDPALAQLSRDLASIMSRSDQGAGAHQQRSDSQAVSFSLIAAVCAILAVTVSVIGFVFHVSAPTH